jgi:2-polyprenyl-3-methyl-5-hydroxy-6-metoxy-1,4-benzoquinol methylase
LTTNGDPLDTYANNSDFWIKIIREKLDRYRTDLTDQAVLQALGDVRELRVLDGGCGEGYMSRLIAARGAREVVGIDTSSSLINAAATHEDVGSLSISHYVASLESIPEKDATFDTVVCNHVLSDVTNPETALREIGRVLRPSGRFVALMLHPCFYTAHSERDSRGNIPVRSYFRERHVDQTFVVAGHESPDEVHMNFRSLEFYSRAIIDAGFVITELSEPHPSEKVLDEDQWWRDNFSKPLFLLISAAKR